MCTGIKSVIKGFIALFLCIEKGIKEGGGGSGIGNHPSFQSAPEDAH